MATTTKNMNNGGPTHQQVLWHLSYLTVPCQTRNLSRGNSEQAREKGSCQVFTEACSKW